MCDEFTSAIDRVDAGGASVKFDVSVVSTTFEGIDKYKQHNTVIAAAEKAIGFFMCVLGLVCVE